MNTLSGWQDTIVALATPPGVGAIAVIRLSGEKSFDIANALFPSKDLKKQKTHTAHFGSLASPATLSKRKNESQSPDIIDEVLVIIFKNPKSYTGEDVVEISCHGSPYIQQQIINACTASGARLALPGEFTQRAFLNGKMDLAQAEAVADVIAANSRAAQQTALKQLRGGFSTDLKLLRDELINFAALIELELDFSEEDVEFADRKQLKNLIANLKAKISGLIDSFSLGNAIKNGVSVAIIGKPNAGKSTLLNALLNEERAIVSEIAGTTRDTIEETLNIKGVLFRLIDTAGIRAHTADRIESLGIERSKQNAAKADIILHLIDMTDDEQEVLPWLNEMSDKTIEVHTKFDKWCDQMEAQGIHVTPDFSRNPVAAKTGFGIEQLKNVIFEKAIGDNINTENTIITNARHLEALLKIKESLEAIRTGIKQGLSSDLLTTDIRRALHYLGEITGQVEVDRDILGTIFGKFCIGK